MADGVRGQLKATRRWLLACSRDEIKAKEIHMPREQGQNPQQKGRNPGTLPPEDDDTLEADQGGIDPQDEAARQQAQGDRRKRPEENIEQVPVEETDDADDDADESDHISQRP
jgi:hypothetical protein